MAGCMHAAVVVHEASWRRRAAADEVLRGRHASPATLAGGGGGALGWAAVARVSSAEAAVRPHGGNGRPTGGDGDGDMAAGVVMVGRPAAMWKCRRGGGKWRGKMREMHVSGHGSLGVAVCGGSGAVGEADACRGTAHG